MRKLSRHGTKAGMAGIALVAALWVGRAMGTDTGDTAGPEDTGEPPTVECLVTKLPQTVAPSLSNNATLGYLQFANGPGGNGNPLNIDSEIHTVPTQMVPQPLMAKVQSTTNPSVPTRFRFVTMDLDDIGVAIKNNSHNNVLSMHLFYDVVIDLSSKHFRNAELTSGHVFQWVGRLHNPQGGASQVIKATYQGQKLRVRLSQGSKDYQIIGSPGGVYVFVEFNRELEPNTTCGT